MMIDSRATLRSGILLVGLLMFSAADAQVSGPFLFEDVNQSARDVLRVEEYFELNEATVMILSSGSVLSTDGTQAGTVRLTEPLGVTREIGVTPDGDRLFFVGSDDLWVTDGTPGGTVQLTTEDDVELPSPTVRNSFVSPISNRVYFERRKPNEADAELWTSDGTLAGTRQIQFEQFPDGTRSFSFGAELDGDVIFRVTAGVRRWLFKSDGTSDGTEPIRDVEDVEVDAVWFLALGDRVLFRGEQEATGSELWATDGTAEGTRLLAESIAGPGSELWLPPIRSGDQAFAAIRGNGRRLLYATDGTPAGTHELVAFDEPEVSTLSGLQVFGDGVLFAGWDPETGRELWSSDGTGPGTRLLADLCPGPCSSALRLGTSLATGLEGVDGFFVADDGSTGLEPYMTDGATEGTRRIADLCPRSCSAEPKILALRGERLFFLARDGVDGLELYTSLHGETPVRLTDFPQRRPFFNGKAGSLKGRLVLVAMDVQAGGRLWQSDGTVPGTLPRVTLFDPPLLPESSFPSGFAAFGGALLFTAFDALDGLTLYRKRGVGPAQRLDVVGLDEFLTPPIPSRSVVVDDRLFLVAAKRSGAGRFRLFVSDGLPGDLQLLLETDSEPEELTSAAGRLFFLQSTVRELWVTDGTVDGTRPVTGPGSSVRSIASLEDRLAFIPRNAESEIWTTDGSTSGPQRILDASDLALQSFSDLTSRGTTLYFLGEDFDSTRIFRSDGTPAGTDPLTPTDLAARQILGFLDDRVVFGTFESGTGTFSLWITGDGPDEAARLLGDTGIFEQAVNVGDELWLLNEDQGLFRTDGTPEDTRRVMTIPPDVDVLEIHAVPGRLLVRGFRNGMGELWVIDGTPGGTRRLGAFEALGSELFVHDGRAVFSADDGEVGMELWASNVGNRPPPPPNPSDVPAAPRNLWVEGRDQSVRLTWIDASDNEERFVVEARSIDLGAVFEEVAVVPPNGTSVELGLLDTRPTNFRVRAENAVGESAWSQEAAGIRVLVSDSACGPSGSISEEVLCLQNGRFQVRSYWRNEDNAEQGVGRSTAFDFSDDSGTFWFFDPANVELVVKVLDARVVNGFFWHFYGALSNVEYWVVVTDTQAETNVTYFNPPGNICGVGDTSAFPRPGLTSAALEAGAGTAVCTPGPDTLCLTPDRYRVEVTWRDPRSGDTGVGHAIPGTTDSGYFWFFDPANVELVVKVLNATSVNGHTWVFFGALTDIEYTVTVTDTVTGEEKSYFNPPGNICGQADVTAF